MWKLTIEQEKKSDFSDYPLTNKAQFASDDLSELVMIVERLAHCKEMHKTEYKIEREVK